MIYEKKYYHDQVFDMVAHYLREFDYHDDNLERLLTFGSMMIGDYERSFYEVLNSGDSLNRNKNERLIEIVSEFINHVERLLLDIPNSTEFRIVKRYIRKREAYNRGYITQPLFVFFKLIRYIVEDVNSLINWERVKTFLVNNMNNYLFDNRNGTYIQRPITFLSYAFKDDTYALFLFFYFYNHGGFLYVDSLFSPILPNGAAIKLSLTHWITVSSNILFLRSLNSEKADLDGELNIRSWCSWEIGHSYANPKTKGYYRLDIAGVSSMITPIIDDFEVFNDVEDGRII